MQQNPAGERALFSRVISDAYHEAILSYEPQLPSKIILDKREKRAKVLRKAFIFAFKMYSFAENNEFKILFLLMDLLKKINRVIDFDPQNRHEKAYYARLFLSDQNPDFCWYCTQLSVDPVYAAEKLNKEIALSDEREKIFFINAVKLLTFKKSIPMMKYILKLIA
jgi:hypothetical protein